MLLFLYSGLLILGATLITMTLINEKRKNKSVSNNFIRDKLSEFLKIPPLMHKIEILEEELRHKKNPQTHSVFAIPAVTSEDGWREKYEKLEALFEEKSVALGKIEQALNNEIKNRTEFENFQYLLEEEIEKGKEKRRQLQAELDIMKTENENLRSQLAQRENQPSAQL